VKPPISKTLNTSFDLANPGNYSMNSYTFSEGCAISY
jgi:hypothetical protein